MNFTWDPRKAKTNLSKHAVSFDEACSVFLDTLSATGADPDHSIGEVRWLTFGMSSSGRLLVVSHIEHGDTIRIISARACTAAERKFHEKN